MPDIRADYVGVFPYRLLPGGPQYLVLRRSQQVAMPGIWQCVTGSLEPGETAVQAALRELREETGLAPQTLWNINFCGVFYDWKRDVIQATPHIGALLAPDAKVTLSHEHEACVWAPIERAEELALWTTQRQAYRWLHDEIALRARPDPRMAIPLPE